MRLEMVLWVGGFALFGLCIGSFLNVVAYRVPRGESVVAPPSRCPACGERVRPYDLIPVVSYVLLRGRCRFCATPIGLRYPAVELLTGTAFAIAAWRMPWSAEAFAGALLSAVLIAVVITDIDWRIIPNRIIAWELVWACCCAVSAIRCPGGIMRWRRSPARGCCSFLRLPARAEWAEEILSSICSSV